MKKTYKFELTEVEVIGAVFRWLIGNGALPNVKQGEDYNGKLCVEQVGKAVCFSLEAELTTQSEP